MIEEAVKLVEDGSDLSMEQMSETIGQIMEGQVEEDLVARLLKALHEKGETVAEVAGAALYRAGRYGQAAELLAEAQRIDRNTIGDYRSRWTFFLSMALHKQGRIEEARSWYDQAVDTLRAERISVPENEDPAWPTHSWNNRITVELIRQEAAGLLGIDLEADRPGISNNP